MAIIVKFEDLSKKRVDIKVIIWYNIVMLVNKKEFNYGVSFRTRTRTRT